MAKPHNDEASMRVNVALTLTGWCSWVGLHYIQNEYVHEGVFDMQTTEQMNVSQLELNYKKMTLNPHQCTLEVSQTHCIR